MKVLRFVPLAIILAACSSVSVPLSPYRIDVQQGNALEQESVEKLKTGLNRSQVRFLLGTPLLVDPFHGNRWDYVYNFRKAGKLTEERRLALFFDGDVLVRIEAEGLTLKNDQPEAKPADAKMAPETSLAPPKAAAAEANPVAVALPVAAPSPVQSAPVADAGTAAKPAEPAAKPAEPAPTQAAPAATVQPATVAAARTEAQPVASAAAKKAPAIDGERSLSETSIVPPLGADSSAVAAKSKPAAVSSAPPEPVALQTEANVDAVKPDVMPAFSDPASASPAADSVVGAINAWAEAWRSRNEDAYLAAYAPSFRPEGGQTREEWEKRRRLLLGVSRNIDLQIDGVATEAVSEERAQVSFRQFYRSETYRDAVIKQLVFVRVDNRWLIEEEKVLASIKVSK